MHWVYPHMYVLCRFLRIIMSLKTPVPFLGITLQEFNKSCSINRDNRHIIGRSKLLSCGTVSDGVGSRIVFHLSAAKYCFHGVPLFSPGEWKQWTIIGHMWNAWISSNAIRLPHSAFQACTRWQQDRCFPCNLYETKTADGCPKIRTSGQKTPDPNIIQEAN